MFRQTAGTLLALLLCSSAIQSHSVSWGGDVAWKRVQLDARFRSEGVAVADVNHDGKMDVLAGDVWYAAPNWKRSEIRPAGDYWAGDGYSNSFANWAFDVNGDGWDDLIYIGFPGAPFHWYENPKNEPGHWKEHVIWHSACNESPQFVDLTGDGRPELVLGSDPEKQMGYLEVPKGEAAYRKWDFVPISEPGDPGKNGTFKYYHGLGVTDCNGDGRIDVVIPHGWWEHPEQLGQGPWTFHEHNLTAQAGGGPEKGADIHSEDLDGDGDVDFVMSSAHAHGVWWFENTGDKESRFTGHLVDQLCSQTHAMHFVDMNGDGKKDLVSGKRYFAHNGGDPGAKDPVQMFWYEIERTKGEAPKFIRHDIPAGLDTGIGTQFAVADMNGDGRPDIVLSNKKGVNILLQHPQ